MSAQGNHALRMAASVPTDGRRGETVARLPQGQVTCDRATAVSVTSGRGDVRHCNLRRGPRILGGVPVPPSEDFAMRCLHHVYLRGGLALLLLASAGVGALTQPAAACAQQAHAVVATAA